MATEDDALKTLQNIEKLLKSASLLTTNKQTFSSKTQASQRERADREAKKAFKAVAASGKEANDAILGLSKGLIGLTDEVDKSTKGFNLLNTQMTKFMSSLQPIQVPERADHQEINFDNTQLLKSMNLWGERTVTAINNVAKILNHQPLQATQPTQKQGFFAGLFARAQSPAQQTPQQNVVTPTPPQQPPGNPMQSVIQRMVSNFGVASASSGGLGTAFGHLWEATVKITADFFQLSRVGMGTASNLGELYKYALLAGMSLKEYTALISQSITAASRAGTLENFDKIISSQDSVLAGMGIFGSEAKQLQASLAQSSAVLGININNLSGAMSAQTKLFGDLRKSVNLTADEFAKMVAVVSNNEQVQKELLGLGPRERQARMMQLLQLQSVGTKLGMTAEASAALGKALIDQRKATVKDRFEQAGALLQMGAFTGNGALGQRAMELNMKGRRRTKAEDEELFNAVRSLDQAAQGLYEVGGLGTQNVLDQFEEMIGKNGLGELARQGRGATLASDAGTVNQEAFGKNVGEFGQWVGKLTAWTRGLQESVLGPLALGIGGVLATVFRGPISKILSKAVGGGGAGVTAVAGSAQKLAAPFAALRTNMGALLTSTTGWIKNIGTTFQTTKAAYPGFSGWLMGMAKGVGEAGKGLAAAGSSVLKGAMSFIGKMGPLSGIIGVAIEAFTGEISDALNPSGGLFNRIGGMITAFFTAIPNFIIDTLAWVFGEKALQPIRNGFDIFVAYMNFAIKDFFATFIGGAESLLKMILPDDSKLVKALGSMREGLIDSATENVAAVEKLWADQSASLSSISAQTQKSAKDQTKITEAATDQAVGSQKKFNNVMAADALSRQGIIQDATALIASPQVQVPKQMAPATVNTDDARKDNQQRAAQVQDNSDIVNLLKSILQALTDNVAIEKQQVANLDALLRISRPGVSFESSEAVANRIIRR